MPNYATLSHSSQDDLTVIEVLARRIYLHVVEEFRQELQDVIQGNASHVLLSMEKVSVMNSAALGVLIAVHDQLQKQNRAFVVSNLQPLMKEIFARMKLESLITVAGTKEEGLELLRAQAK